MSAVMAGSAPDLFSAAFGPTESTLVGLNSTRPSGPSYAIPPKTSQKCDDVVGLLLEAGRIDGVDCTPDVRTNRVTNLRREGKSMSHGM